MKWTSIEEPENVELVVELDLSYKKLKVILDVSDGSMLSLAAASYLKARHTDSNVRVVSIEAKQFSNIQ